MALIRPNGEYISVVKGSVTPDCIPYIIHKDKNQRKRLKEGNLDKFEQVIRTHLFVPVDFSTIADPTKSIEDNQTTAAYIAMQSHEDFLDCVEA